MSRTLFVTALLCLAACRPDPEDLFFIVGDVVDPFTQTPIAGAPVRLDRQKSDTCLFARERENAFVSPVDAGVYLPLLDAEADDEGRYLFELMRFQVSANDSRPYCLRISYEAPEDGATVQVTTFAGYADLQVPSLLHWSPALAANASGAEVTVDRPVLPIEPSLPVDLNDPDAFAEGYALYAYEWEAATPDLAALWREEAAGPLVLTPEQREDFDASVALGLFGATAKVSGSLFQGTDFYALTQRSAPVGLPAGTLVPASRGAPCETAITALDPCPLTDGALGLVRLGRRVDDGTIPGFESWEFPSELRIDFDGPRTLRQVIVRDLFAAGGPGSELLLAGSNDLETWTELARHPIPVPQEVVPALSITAGGGLYAAIPLDPAHGPFLHLRLSVASPDSYASLYGLRELSAFE